MNFIFLDKDPAGIGNISISCDDKYLRLVIHKDTDINISIVKQIHRIINNQGNNKSTLIRLEPFLFFDREARDYMNKVHQRFGNRPVAIIADTFNERLLAKFYNNFYKPNNAYKIFKCETEALNWLKVLQN